MIERLAAAGMYHYDIAERLGFSVSTIEQSVRLLREAGRLGSMRGPRAMSARVDWDWACAVWFDPAISVQRAIDSIGCSERTIYRKLGPRARCSAPIEHSVVVSLPLQKKKSEPFSMQAMRGTSPR